MPKTKFHYIIKHIVKTIKGLKRKSEGDRSYIYLATFRRYKESERNNLFMP